MSSYTSATQFKIRERGRARKSECEGGIEVRGREGRVENDEEKQEGEEGIIDVNTRSTYDDWRRVKNITRGHDKTCLFATCYFRH